MHSFLFHKVFVNSKQSDFYFERIFPLIKSLIELVFFFSIINFIGNFIQSQNGTIFSFGNDNYSLFTSYFGDFFNNNLGKKSSAGILTRCIRDTLEMLKNTSSSKNKAKIEEEPQKQRVVQNFDFPENS
jgi:hypothetical protein